MIQKPFSVDDAKLEELFRRIFMRAQPTEHRLFTSSAITTADLTMGEVALAVYSASSFVYANVNNVIKKVQVT